MSSNPSDTFSDAVESEITSFLVANPGHVFNETSEEQNDALCAAVVREFDLQAQERVRASERAKQAKTERAASLAAAVKNSVDAQEDRTANHAASSKENAELGVKFDSLHKLVEESLVFLASGKKPAGILKRKERNVAWGPDQITLFHPWEKTDEQAPDEESEEELEKQRHQQPAAAVEHLECKTPSKSERRHIRQKRAAEKFLARQVKAKNLARQKNNRTGWARK
jgi:hypothetical protein